MPRTKKTQSLQPLPTDEELNAESTLVALSIKLTPKMLEQLRDRAERIGIGYQALMKVYLDAGLQRDGY